jgi:hypothetical protein
METEFFVALWGEAGARQFAESGEAVEIDKAVGVQ